MSNRLNVQQTARLLLEQDDILILTHQNPDGDTMGCGYSLCLALQQLGKRAMVLCADPVPSRMAFITAHLDPALTLTDPEMAKFVMAVDVADVKLLGSALAVYQQPGMIRLCIDHHPSNREYAADLLLEGEEAAACQIIYDVILAMGCEMTPAIAECLYLGIATDTGCFRYSNTQPRSHLIAAKLMETGINWYEINKVMFEVKSHAQMELERGALQTIRFCCGGKAAMLSITQKLLAEAGATMEDTENITAIARNIEGVEIGATLKERPEGGFKVSIRTSEQVDACQICSAFGGGGHMRAAGCLIKEPLERVMELLEKRFEAVFAGEE